MTIALIIVVAGLVAVLGPFVWFYTRYEPVEAGIFTIVRDGKTMTNRRPIDLRSPPQYAPRIISIVHRNPES